MENQHSVDAQLEKGLANL